MTSQKKLCPLAVIILVLLASGCKSTGKKVAQGLVDGVTSRQESLNAMTTEILATLGGAFDTSITPRLQRAITNAAGSFESTANRLLDSVEATVKRGGDSAGLFIAQNLSDSLSVLLGKTTRLVREEVDTAIDTWAGTLSSKLRNDMALAGEVAAARIVDGTVERLAAGLDSSGALSNMVVSLGDRVVRQAVRAIAEESRNEGNRVSWVVWVAGAVVLLLVVAALGRFILALKRDARRGQQSLRIMGAAIKERGDPALADTVQRAATTAGVEPWLNEFLSKERLIMKKPA